MKWILVAAVALTIGFVAGGYAPRSELARTQEALAEARAEVERGHRERSTWMSGLGGILAQRAAASRVEAPPPAGPQAPKVPSAAAPPQAPPRDPGEDGDEASGDGGTDGGGTELHFDPKDSKSFEAMRSAAELRSGQYRAAFVESAHLDARKQQALDEIVHSMNAEVAREAERLAAGLASGSGKLRTREMVDVALGLAQIYQRSDDRLGQLLDPTEQAAAGKTGFDLLTQVDLQSVRRLFEVTATRQEGAEPGPGVP